MCRNFDPWGVRLNGTGVVNTTENRWELQGKEKEMTFNLNRVDFGARVYNPTIGRWDKVDPMAEKYYPYSPYNYTLNNPINSIDPDGNEVFDWIKNKETNQYVWDSNVTSAANTPENFEYVGRSVNDVQKHFEKNNPVASFLGMKPSFGENRTSYPGEIAQNTPNWIDNWASSDNMLASASYSLANSFSVTLQSLNPFDNQITSLTREDLGGADRSGYGAEAISSLIPSGSVGHLTKGIQVLKSPLVLRDVSLRGLGNTTFRIGLRDVRSNFMIRLERDMMKAKSGPPFKATHINVHQPGKFNYHFKLNPLKWGK